MTPSEGALKKADKDAEELRPLDCEGVDWPLDCESCGEIDSISQLMLQRYKAGFREGAKLAAKQDFEKSMDEELKKLVKMHPSSKECYDT